LIVHWDDVEPYRAERGPMSATWRNLGRAAGSVGIGVKRIQIDPGKLSTPPHIHGLEEEVFYVLGGSGLLWQDGATCEVGPGDTIVHAGDEAHTLVGGDDGLDVLVFGQRRTPESGYLPRSGNLWVGFWAVRALDHHPWQDEAELGMPDLPPAGERPANVVALADAQSEFDGIVRRLGAGAGARRIGLNYVAAPPGDEGAPPHLHTVEEEFFVVLEGEGVLELWPAPLLAAGGTEREEHPLRPGHVIARPPGTRLAHAFRAGDQGMSYLAFGTREPSDIAFYPRSNKIFFRGAGLIARLEHLDYFDGED
jgi:uncharacterized cupin superfamily protein